MIMKIIWFSLMNSSHDYLEELKIYKERDIKIINFKYWRKN